MALKSWRAAMICLALAAAPTLSAPALAQPKPAAAALSAQNYVGRWTGETDWRGIEGYDAVNAWWDFRPNGTFVDNHNETGTWTVGADGYITFTYDLGSRSRYYGVIVGGTLLGTMTNGESTGVFAFHR
jgi:hypothetical protein